MSGAALFPASNASAITAPTNQADCTALGGTWVNNDHIKNLCTLPPILNMTPEQQAQSYVYYYTLGNCLSNGFLHDGGGFSIHQRINVGDITSGLWFAGSNQNGGGYLNGINGIKTTPDGSGQAGTQIDCQQTGLVKGALSLWNNWPPDEALCAFGYVRASGPASRCTDAQGGTDEFMKGNNVESSFKTAVLNRIYGGKTPTLTDAAKYLLYLKSFQTACVPNAKASTTPPTGSSNNDYAVKIVSGSGKDATVSTVYYTDYQNLTKDAPVYLYPNVYLSPPGAKQTCGSLLNAINGLASAYKDYLNATDSSNASGGTDQGSALCVSGAATDANGQPCKSANGDTKTSCVIDSVGWIVCPLVGFFSTMSDLMYGWIQNYLTVQPLNTNTSSSDNTMFIAWNIIRNFANIAFVIAFIIIIYSQLTGVGVSNYGVKKTLPRLIVAAILVNISYWIGAVAVDLSNIIGNNIYELLKNLPLGNVHADSNGWEALSSWLLAGGTAGALTIAGLAITTSGAWASVGMVALYALIPIVIMVVLALIVAFLVLAMRQALIIILIVIAPLAFVAYLLPNTEKYFTSWRKALTTLLVFYPVFSIVFGGSYVAGMIIIGSAGQHSDNGPAVLMTVLLGMAVTAVPLAITPLIVRFSSGAMGQFASALNARIKKSDGGLVNASRKLRNRKAGLAMGEALSNTSSRNPFGRIYRRVQNNARLDSDRKKVIETTSQAAYQATDKAADVAYLQKAADQNVKAANLSDQVRFEESLAHSQAVSGNSQIAKATREARKAHEQIEVAENRARSAGNVLQQEFAHELQQNADLAREAGGIDPYGQSRVIAAATSVSVEASNKAIAAEKVTMTRNSAAELTAIMKDSTATDERRAAAAGQLLKVGTDNDIYSAIDYIGSQMPAGEARTLIQQQFAADIGSRKPISVGAAALSNLSRGQFSGTFDSQVVGRVTAGKISAEGLASATSDELDRIIQVINSGQIPTNDPQLTKLQEQIKTFLGNPNSKLPANEIIQRMNNIAGVNGNGNGSANGSLNIPHGPAPTI